MIPEILPINKTEHKPPNLCITVYIKKWFNKQTPHDLYSVYNCLYNDLDEIKYICDVNAIASQALFSYRRIK
jgi:hypothetical protein